jgi:hypothetical protein
MLYVYFKFGSQNTSMEMVGASTDLFHLDNTRVDAALDAMLLFLHKDAQGGCWGRPRLCRLPLLSSLQLTLPYHV